MRQAQILQARIIKSSRGFLHLYNLTKMKKDTNEVYLHHILFIFPKIAKPLLNNFPGTVDLQIEIQF